ncbi:MAG: HEAT repeat domain-containing protein [Chromatiaceae bacterium]|jgi:hypothetical protein|nr:HEAT repeat domain-containing protein [Chromatiaceae bacterium]
MSPHQLPSALLFVSPGCPHCPAVLGSLARLIKDGRLAGLEVVNLSADPERGREMGVRGVPWTRIGPFELVGNLSAAEIAEWVEYAARGDGWSAYYVHLLENRRLEEVVRRIRDCPSTFSDLLALLAGEETSMATRVAISAVVEELSGTEALDEAVPDLEQLTLSELAQTRADACHFLGLSGNRQALPAVRRLLEDEHPDVREIALETLAILGEAPTR